MTKTSILFLCLFAFITTGNCKECKACYDSICINLTRFSACQELKCIITCDTIIAQFTDLTHECNSNSQLIVCNFHYNRLFNFVNDLFFQNRNSFFIVNDKNEDFSYCSEFDFIDITISHNDSYEERYHIELDHGILKQEKMYYIWDRKIIFSSIFIEFVNLLYEMFPSNNSDGLDWYDSQARMYDPLLGRTPTMDALAEKYYSISPYAWCGGNPQKTLNRRNEPDSQYGNKEDKRVIEGSEQETAKKLGKIKDKEVTRRDHFGTGYKVASPDSDDVEGIIVVPSSGVPNNPNTPDRHDIPKNRKNL